MMPEYRTFTVVMLIVTCSVLLSDASYAQAIGEKNATLTVSGSSFEVNFGNHHYLVQQSIGQAGPTGLISSESTTLRQGFIQPLQPVTQPQDGADADVGIYPNPFLGVLTISLPGKQVDKALISLSDVLGREVFTQWAQSRIIRIETADLASGQYILKILSPRKQHIVKLIKE